MTTKDHEPENDGWSVREVHDLGDDPLNHDGDGTIREGDPMYDLMMRMATSGEPMVAQRRDDGMWEVSVGRDGSPPEIPMELHLRNAAADEPASREWPTLVISHALIVLIVALTFTYLLTR